MWGLQVVHHQCDPVSLRVLDVDQLLDGQCPVSHGAPFTDPHVARPGERLQHHEQVGDAVADVFMLESRWATR